MSRTLGADALRALLDVTRALAAPFDLHSMLTTVADAGRRVFEAERASVWLLDAPAQELVLEVAADLGAVRIAVGRGIVGLCAQQSRIVEVPDCYADPRFDRALDLASGFHTRNLVALPLVDHHGVLVGVLQLLNRPDGSFDQEDIALGEALAAQCAVALSRVRMTQAMLAGELMRQELQLASEVQRASLPADLPAVPGYELAGSFRPASLTGGDTYDVARLDAGVLVVLADAAGHGVPAALSIIQMHAMLRMAFELGATLEQAFLHVNNRLSATLPDGRFVTAFIGLLDPATHRLRYLSGGQGPILHWHAATGGCTVHRATSFPMGAMALRQAKPAACIDLQPGDLIALLSDGFYEYESPTGEAFGRARVEAVMQQGGATAPVQALAAALLRAVELHAEGAPQEDDMTLVLLRRLPVAP